MNLPLYRFFLSLFSALLLLPVCGFISGQVQAQQTSEERTIKSINFNRDSSRKRPIPYPVIRSPQYNRAIDRSTRSTTGEPGPDYWTNYTIYDLQAQLSPATKTLRGQGDIRYINRSPDTLQRLVLHLRQNFYRKGNIRNRQAAITGGMELSRIQVDGVPLIDQENRSDAGYHIRGPLLYIDPPKPVAPGDSIRLQMAWSFKIPPAGGSRIGQDGEVFFIGYWYPQMAVYDEVRGWYAQPYMGDGEFYMGYADYNVDITVPEGWLVGATGQAVNLEQVVTKETLDRLKKARNSDEIVSIVGPDERKAGISTRSSENGQLTWRFKAQKVRDFAFGTSNNYVWDATRAKSASDQYALIHSFYRPEYQSWQHGAKFTRFAIENLSKRLISYPWSHMTVMEGILGGGMEYPMITIIASEKSKKGLFGTIYHETAHMWFPMMAGSNEKRYTWMDEGLVTFLTNEGAKAYWPDAEPWAPGESSYYYIAGSGREVPSMRHGDRYPVHGPARGIASYSKPGLMLHTLRGIVGNQTFNEAFRAYVERWSYKHPYPYDLFNTFEQYAGRDLDWFWTSTLYNTWTLDHSIKEVNPDAKPIQITVFDEALMPMPVTVQCTYEYGNTERTEIPVYTWLDGNRRATVTCPAGNLQQVTLDPEHYLPDLDRSDNVWTSE